MRVWLLDCHDPRLLIEQVRLVVPSVWSERFSYLPRCLLLVFYPDFKIFSYGAHIALTTPASPRGGEVCFCQRMLAQRTTFDLLSEFYGVVDWNAMYHKINFWHFSNVLRECIEPRREGAISS